MRADSLWEPWRQICGKLEVERAAAVTVEPKPNTSRARSRAPPCWECAMCSRDRWAGWISSALSGEMSSARVRLAPFDWRPAAARRNKGCAILIPCPFYQVNQSGVIMYIHVRLHFCNLCLRVKVGESFVMLEVVARKKVYGFNFVTSQSIFSHYFMSRIFNFSFSVHFGHITLMNHLTTEIYNAIIWYILLVFDLIFSKIMLASTVLWRGMD